MNELFHEGISQPLVSVSAPDWSLHRKGPADQARHNEKVKEIVKQNLGEIVGQQDIITSDGKKIVRIPIRSLELPRFRFGNKGEGVGQGQGGTKKGDILGDADGQQPGSGPGAGDMPGIDYYEAEITIDDIVELAFADLSLPFLDDRGERLIESETIEFKDIRKKGLRPNIDKKRTIIANLKRNARDKNPHVGGFIDNDLRFKTWEKAIRKEKNAVVIAMRDVSGSMGEFEKYISRTFYSWMIRFLRTKYHSVEIVFITHHTEARKVDEETFFKLGESGGTKVSSAYELCSQTVTTSYNPKEWNIYPFHFSDGDNWGDVDNKLCVDLVKKLIKDQGCNVFGYGEIKETGRGALTTLMSAFKPVMEKEPRFIGVTIGAKNEVFPALQKFFHQRTGEDKKIV